MDMQSLNKPRKSAEVTTWDVEVFYDGDCPLCRREINLLRRWDRRSRIRFTDIADPHFSAEKYGLSQEQFMAEIQGRLPDGSWLTGVEVFRHLYSAVGFGPVVSLSRLPGIRQTLNVMYRFFAKRRLKWTGRCDETCPIDR